MHQLTCGAGTREDWDFVARALNITAILAEIGIGADWFPEIKLAMAAHIQCGKRLETTGRAGYTGPQLTAVNLALEVHDAQLDEATVQQIEKADAEMDRRLRVGIIDHSLKELAV